MNTIEEKITKENYWEMIKITSASTKTVVCDIFMDGFPKYKKVRIQNAEYGGSKKKAECWVTFEDWAYLANRVLRGELFRELEKIETEKDPKKDSVVISIGGSPSSKNYNGAPESRMIKLKKSKDSIFINITRGKGKLSETGAILPDGAPDVVVGVPVKAEKLASMILYTHDYINAYLAGYVSRLCKDLKDYNEANNNNQ